MTQTEQGDGIVRAEELFSLVGQFYSKPIIKSASRLSRGEGGVLLLLYCRKAVVTSGELCRMFDVGSGRIANILKNLEEKNLITRDRSQSDKRVVSVRITEAGKAEAEALRRVPLEHAARLLDKLGKRDTESFLRILNKLYEIEAGLETSGDAAAN